MTVENINNIKRRSKDEPKKRYKETNQYVRECNKVTSELLCLLTYTKFPEDYEINKEEIEAILNSFDYIIKWVRKQIPLCINIMREDYAIKGVDVEVG